MIEIIITGETNKGKIALAKKIAEYLEFDQGIKVNWPLEQSFPSGGDRDRYAAESEAKGDLEGLEVQIKTVKREKSNPLEPRKITRVERAKGRPENFYELTPREQWDVDKRLGILDWEPTKEEVEAMQKELDERKNGTLL